MGSALTSICTERSVWVSVSVRVLETRVHSARGPKPPRDAAALGGKHTRSSCNDTSNPLYFVLCGSNEVQQHTMTPKTSCAATWGIAILWHASALRSSSMQI